MRGVTTVSDFLAFFVKVCSQGQQHKVGQAWLLALTVLCRGSTVPGLRKIAVSALATKQYKDQSYKTWSILDLRKRAMKFPGPSPKSNLNFLKLLNPTINLQKMRSSSRFQNAIQIHHQNPTARREALWVKELSSYSKEVPWEIRKKKKKKLSW
jgi:hypothetical protein